MDQCLTNQWVGSKRSESSERFNLLTETCRKHGSFEYKGEHRQIRTRAHLGGGGADVSLDVLVIIHRLYFYFQERRARTLQAVEVAGATLRLNALGAECLVGSASASERAWTGDRTV
ncbi:hypothetical protein NFJ02_33g83890 [Pycnococcus provasolii]